MTEWEWLASLKPGDEVFVSQPYQREHISSKVSRITKTMIMIGCLNATGEFYEQRFTKNGRSVGTSLWAVHYLIQPSDDIRNEIRVGKLKQIARHLKDKLSIPEDEETLREFIECLRKFVKEEKIVAKTGE